MIRYKVITSIAIVGISALVAAGCSSDSGEGDQKITVSYWDSGQSEASIKVLENAKEQFEEENEGWEIVLSPIEASEGDYATKLALMNRSEETAPDVIYEDTYRISADAAAGFLAPLDEYLDDWDEWGQIPEAAHAGVRGLDGKIYGIPVDTDTRGLWYNKNVLEEAGVEVPWEPKTWDDLIDAARKVKEAKPDALPMNMYSGKAMAEATTMQGFDMLLYGTGDTLYNHDTNKWIIGSQGFIDALEFENTIFSENLGPTPQQLANPSWGQIVRTELFPADEIGFNLDGSWFAGGWGEGQEDEWDGWDDVVGWTYMPTQNGQAPGRTSMSGGWAMSMGAHAEHKEMTFKYMSIVTNFENSLDYAIGTASMPVRSDIAADKRFIDSNPSLPFWVDLVEDTHFRPITPEYEKISSEIQNATEKVLTGAATPEQAAAAYDEAVIKIVGEDKVEKR